MIRFFKRLSKQEKGFTLIELLVVIAIIGVLATVAVPRVIDAVSEARGTKSTADLKIIETALERFYADHGVYPPKLNYLLGTESGISTAYIKRNFTFKNSFGEYYFYAISYGGSGSSENGKHYVLGDPGQDPSTGASSGMWSNTTTPLPEGQNPDVGAWAFGTNVANENIGSVPIELENGSTNIRGTLKSIGTTTQPTRGDLYRD